MLKSLVSPLFLQEMGKARKKEIGFKIPPMPEGYSFQRVTNKKYALYFKKEIIDYFQQLGDITDKVKIHQAKLTGKKVYTTRRMSTYKINIYLNGEFIRTCQSQPAADRYIESKQ